MTNTCGRDVKFRAWDGTRMLQWHSGIIAITHNLDVETIGYPAHLPRWSILMQYTGLKDRQGQDIYDGDICRVDHQDPRYPVKNAVVFWDRHEAGWSVGIGIPSEARWSHRVIGNVCENPDLLADVDRPDTDAVEELAVREAAARLRDWQHAGTPYRRALGIDGGPPQAWQVPHPFITTPDDRDTKCLVCGLWETYIEHGRPGAPSAADVEMKISQRGGSRP